MDGESLQDLAGELSGHAGYSPADIQRSPTAD
jgi:hypothetical protein